MSVDQTVNWNIKEKVFTVNIIRLGTSKNDYVRDKVCLVYAITMLRPNLERSKICARVACFRNGGVFVRSLWFPRY